MTASAEISPSRVSFFKYEGLNSDKDRCLITLDEFKADDTCAKINACGHTFFQDSLKKWHDEKILYFQKPSCPLCRREFTISLEDHSRTTYVASTALRPTYVANPVLRSSLILPDTDDDERTTLSDTHFDRRASGVSHSERIHSRYKKINNIKQGMLCAGLILMLLGACGIAAASI